MQQRLDLGFQFLDLLPAGIDTLQAIGQFLAALCQLLAQHLGLRVTDQDLVQNVTTRSRRA